MRTIRVWAPMPKVVELQVEQQTFPMQRSAEGCWSASVTEQYERSDYGFIVDGEGPFPDPRSSFQASGIHGLSRWVDHGNFKWTDAKWEASPLSAAIIYELHIGTFTDAGTFRGAIEKLDHLAGLGITHVELMPVNEFSGDHGWGYDGVGLFAPHHVYGSPDDLKSLVNECHARGLGVLLDVVYNHLGPAGNYLAKFGPYFTDRYSQSWGQAVNLDGTGSDEVRRFFCDNALMWLRDYHFDGLRLDAVHAMMDSSATHFLEQLSIEVEHLQHELGRNLVLIPESDLNDPRLLWPRERSGFSLDAQWSDDFHHALHSVLTGERNGYYQDFGTLADVAKALKNAFVYDGVYSRHRNRHHGRSTAGVSGHHFLGYLQNHDQIGNRAAGERSHQLMSLGRLKIGAALVLTSPFVPMLFQGEEWAASTPFQYFTNHQDEALGKAVREGRRKEFASFGYKPEDIPDPQSEETFKRSKLDWRELETSEHAEILNWHKQLIQLRNQEPSLTDGRLDRVHVNFDEAAKWLVVKRGPIGIFCNLGQQMRTLDGGKSFKLLCASHPDVHMTNSQLQLPPDSVAIIKS